MRFKCLIITLFLICCQCFGDEPETFNIAMLQNLAVYLHDEPEKSDHEDRFKDYLMCVVKDEQNLSEYTKRHTIFKMLQNLLSKQNQQKDSVALDATTCKDLNVFCGQTNELLYLANILDRSCSTFGKVWLCRMLALPTFNKEEFLKKQTLIKELLDKPELCNALQKELTRLSAVENNLLTFWKPDRFCSATRKRYFNFSSDRISDYCNQSASILNARSAFYHQQRILWAAMLAVGAISLPVYAIHKICDSALVPVSMNNALENVYRDARGPIFGLLQAASSDQKYFVGGLAFLTGLHCILHVKNSTEWALDNFLLEKLLYKKMKKIAVAIESVRNINKLLQPHEKLRMLLSESSSLSTLFAQDGTSQELKFFLDHISSHNFKSNDLWVRHVGDSLVAFKSLRGVKKELEAALMAVGQIDACLGIAKLYNEHEHSATPYCFATCLENDKPVVVLKDFWNPLITADAIVCNSVALGGKNNPSGMIVTGPNAGGKSSLLKGVGLSVLITQGLGISPASQAELTLFSMMMTYLNIVDDLAGGNSLFKNQVLRMQKILNTASAMDGSQKGLIILDEMFNGTSPQEAEACAFSVAYLLGKNPLIINLLATHHVLLTQLPAALSAYQNYHVSVVKKSDGTFYYPFKLEESVSDQHVALDILQHEGFDSEIIFRAQQILSNKV